MKKLLLALVCIGSILALPGCWCCRRTCEAPCENYCDDYYDDYCDEGCYDDGCNDGKELIGYEEQQGWRQNVYRERGTRGGRKSAEPATCPVGTSPAVYQNKPTYHKPVHPGVMEHVEKTGKQIRYLDSRWADHNAQLQQEAQAKAARKAMKNGGRAPAPAMAEETM